ncbi:MAG TPA: zf-HC2 domain-containing protein [Vicinamibacterales bacterium]|nr:zf-HC2 domain-containing protein [Vicinamibacterales bacterium]
MMFLRMTCEALRQKLSAFVDGELPGGEMLRVAEHLEVCRECAGEVAGMRDLGDELRGIASSLTPAPVLDGLADGVVIRARAEAAQSWRAVFARAIEDWHWAVVGLGSVAATSTTLLFVSMILTFGPTPPSSESLAALMNNLRRPAGTVILMATPIGHDQEATLMMLDNGGSGGAGQGLGTLPPEFMAQTDRDLVEALTDVVTEKGRLVDLNAMPPDARRYAEWLMDEISRIKSNGSARVPGSVKVHLVGLVTTTGVTAKGL